MVAACVEVWRDERAGLPRAGTIGKRWRAVPLIEPVGLSATPKVWAEIFGSGSGIRDRENPGVQSMSM